MSTDEELIAMLRRQHAEAKQRLADALNDRHYALEARADEAERKIAAVEAWTNGEPFEVSDARLAEPSPAIRPEQQSGFVKGYGIAVEHVRAALSTPAQPQKEAEGE